MSVLVFESELARVIQSGAGHRREDLSRAWRFARLSPTSETQAGLLAQA
jgi:hypothetical protein